MSLDGFPTLDEVQRRQAARMLGLPLSASWAEIRRAKGACEAADETGGEVTITLESGRPITYLPTVDPHIVDAIDLVPLEKDVQQRVRKLYEAAGAVVYNLSQARASKQTPGLPDLWVFHVAADASWWHETKRPGGDRTEAQEQFKERCRLTHTKYTCGGVDAARQMLTRLGIPVPSGFED